MNDPANPWRRKLVLGIMALPVSGIAAAAIPTPAASEGPFYPTRRMRFDDVDNDLVKIAGEVEQAGGEVVRLTGRVFDRNGKPVPAAAVEIWQCDVKGRYIHHRDSRSGPRDMAFQGFGRALTDDDGRYWFRTIKPVPYTGRTPHIHVKVLLGKRERLTTQFYLPDHPDNDTDWLYQRIPKARRELVTMNFAATGQEPLALVDLVI